MGTIPKEYKKEVIDALVAETWKVALLNSSFSYVSGTHVLYTDVSAYEISGTGYTAGGASLSGKASGYVDTTNVYLDATDVYWGTGATFSNVGYAVLYRTSDGKIRDIKSFSPAKSVTAGTFTIQWNSGGILKLA